MYPKKVNCIFIFLSLFVWPGLLISSEVSKFEEVQLPSIMYQGDKLYRYTESIYFKFSRYQSADEHYESYKFIVLQADSAKYNPVFESDGSGDSYNLKPHFFTSELEYYPMLILAETGAEYSWGLRVFLLDKNHAVKDLGHLDVAVLEQSGYSENATSAVPYVAIDVGNDGIVFSFTKDIIYDPGGRNEKSIDKNGLYYVYAKDELKPMFK